MTAMMKGKDASNPVLDCLLYVLIWAWNHPRMKSVRKFLYNFKLTVICGVITLLVFRGTLGAGKFGTPSSDIQLVNFELKSFQEDRLLQSAESQQLLWEESVESSKPYRIGPPVTDWDEQRGKLLAMDPGCNETSKGAPLTMIVSGSQPTPCEHNVGDHLLTKFLKTKMDYARVKNMRVYYHMTRLDKEMTGLWAKLPLLRRLMVANPQVEWFWWMDADAAITDMKFDIPWKRYEGINMIVPGWDELVYDEKDWVGLSTGSFLLRNCQWSLDLLEAWSKMGVRGKARNDAGKQLTATLKGRPDIPADDQSALVYLMVQDRPKWGSKVHLEHKYYLHGYWVNLVDKFEKMMETSKPGTGDDRWPFVVHFIGCQLCGTNGEYDANKCITQMVRAFNFADNQVVKPFGYKHLRLNSSILLPTNESTRVTIVETHYLRKKQQKARKEKAGEDVGSLDLPSGSANDSAMAVADQTLVEELLSEGVLALAPGSAPSTDISSLHVVSRRDQLAAAAASGASGAQKPGGVAGQSVAFGPGGGQSLADWRDNVEGISEEELQEKKLEEAESQQLLQLEGGALEAAKIKERAENGEEVEEGEGAKVRAGAAGVAGEGGSAVDRLNAELRKDEGETTEGAESAAEGAGEGEAGVESSAQDRSTEAALAQTKTTEEDAELASEAAKGETQRLESSTTLNSDSLSPLTETLPDTTESAPGATADAASEPETDAAAEGEGVASDEAQEAEADAEAKALDGDAGSTAETEEEGEPSAATTGTATSSRLSSRLTSSRLTSSSLASSSLTNKRLTSSGLASSGFASSGLAGTSVKASAEGAEEGEEEEARASKGATTAGGAGKTEEAEEGEEAEAGAGVATTAAAGARLRTAAGAGETAEGEEGSVQESSEAEGEGEGVASARTGPVARSLVKPGLTGARAGLGLTSLAGTAEPATAESESEGDSASESDGEADASAGAASLAAGTRGGATAADESAEETTTDEAAADGDLKAPGVTAQTLARSTGTPGATTEEEAPAEDQLPGTGAEGGEAGAGEGEQTEAEAGAGEGEQTGGDEGSMMQ